MKRYETASQFFAAAKEWKKELAVLRAILRSTALEETVKWGGPVYTFDGKNVVGIGGFQSYFGLWFFQGALLSDKRQVLINAQEGRTMALRQMRFGSADEIDARLIKAYVKEAIGHVKQGVEIKPERNKPVTVPAALQAAFRKHGEAKTSFAKLTPGRRREYADYIASAKRDETKQKRIEKIIPMIEAGIGLHDKYRSC